MNIFIFIETCKTKTRKTKIGNKYVNDIIIFVKRCIVNDSISVFVCTVPSLELISKVKSTRSPQCVSIVSIIMQVRKIDTILLTTVSKIPTNVSLLGENLL